MDNQRPRRVCLLGLNVCAAADFLAIQGVAQEISWLIPTDGGTPRHTNRIEVAVAERFEAQAVNF